MLRPIYELKEDADDPAGAVVSMGFAAVRRADHEVMDRVGRSDKGDIVVIDFRAGCLEVDRANLIEERSGAGRPALTVAARVDGWPRSVRLNLDVVRAGHISSEVEHQ